MPNETDPDSPTPNPLLMEEIPQTLDELKKKVAELFHCMPGPEAAYFEIPLNSRAHGSCGASYERYVYSTLAWRTSGVNSESTEARLVMAMLEPFIDARRQLVGDQDTNRVIKPLLFWRKPIEIQTYRNHEEALDRTRIHCRVVIPGVNLLSWEHLEGELIRSL